MVKIIYGDKTSIIREPNLTLDDTTLKRLLDGRVVIDIDYPKHSDNSQRKAYYIGVLYELFKHNYPPPVFYNKDIFGMIGNAYPVFINSRQYENVISLYWKQKKVYNVFNPD